MPWQKNGMRSAVGTGRRRWAAVATLLATVVATGAHAQGTAAPPDPPAYAVLGLEGVTIRPESRVVSGAVGALGGAIRLRRQVRVTEVAGPTIRLAAQVRTGTVFCHLVNGPPTLPACNAFTDPLIDPARLASVPVVPGTNDFRIPPHTGTAPLPPGSFRDVRVGKGSVLQLDGGSYMMRSLRIAPQGRVVCAADCRIGVLGSVRLGRDAALGASTAARAGTARVDITLGGPRPAFVAQPRSNVSA